MNDPERCTKLRLLMPDGNHAGDRIAGLLSNAGVPIEWRTNGSLHAKLNGGEDDLSLTIVKNRIIPAFVAEQRYPAAFSTSDRVADYMARAALIDPNLPKDIIEVARFEMFDPRLRVSLLTRDNPVDNEKYKTPGDLRGQRVLTSYIGLGTAFFRTYFPNDAKLPISFDTRIDGKEEGLTEEGDAEAAIVSVDSGGSMVRHHLRELKVVMPRGESQIVLICNSLYLQDEANQVLLEKFVEKLQNGYKSSGDASTSEDVSKLSNPTLLPRIQDGLRNVQQFLFG